MVEYAEWPDDDDGVPYLYVVHKDGEVLKVIAFAYRDTHFVPDPGPYHYVSYSERTVYLHEITVPEDQNAAQAMWELANG